MEKYLAVFDKNDNIKGKAQKIDTLGDCDYCEIETKKALILFFGLNEKDFEE